jgi:hypothetical protein
MPDFNQKKPGEGLTKASDSEREKLLTRNTYKPSEGYGVNHPNAVATGDAKGKGNAQFLSVYDDNIGSSVDKLGNGEANTGRIGNLKNNLYGKNNEYSAGNLDSGRGYQPTVDQTR